MRQLTMLLSLTFMAVAIDACNETGKQEPDIDLTGTWQGTGDVMERIAVRWNEYSQPVEYENILCEDTITIEFAENSSCSYCKSIFDKDRGVMKKCFRHEFCNYEIKGKALTICARSASNLECTEHKGRIIDNSNIVIVENGVEIDMKKVTPEYN